MEMWNFLLNRVITRFVFVSEEKIYLIKWFKIIQNYSWRQERNWWKYSLHGNRGVASAAMLIESRRKRFCSDPIVTEKNIQMLRDKIWIFFVEKVSCVGNAGMVEMASLVYEPLELFLAVKRQHIIRWKHGLKFDAGVLQIPPHIFVHFDAGVVGVVRDQL